jgi:protein-tyrosine-phosphatase
MAEGEAPPRSVLFACTHNVIRSPMAAALARLRFGPILRIESVGVRAGEAADPLAAAVMDELGADLSKHRPRTLAALVADEEEPFDLIVSLSPEAHHRLLDLVPQLGKVAEYWPTFDPSLAEGSREQRLMEFRMVRDGLDRRIAARFPRPSTG